MRKSQAFAAYREQLVAEAHQQIVNELLPNYNSEVEDIRRKCEEIKSSKGEAMADHVRRARIADLRIRQQQFIDGLNEDMRSALSARAQDYGGEIKTIEVEGKQKLEVIFDDKSTARVPRSLWVDYTQFQRV